MHNRSVRHCIYILLRRLLKQPKLFLVLALLFVILDEYVGSARQILKEFSIHVNAYGSFACLTSYSYLLLWIVLGYLILLSDAPYVCSLTLFESLRISSRQMIKARVIYIILISFIYVQFVFLLASIIQIASLFQPFLWDKALNTMSYGTTVGSSYMYVPRAIVTGCSPIIAWLFSSLLLSLSLSSLGLVMFIGSLICDKKVVLCFAGLYAALDFSISYMNLPNSLYYLSPISWSRLEMILTAEYYAYHPSAMYCVLMQCGTFLILYFGAFLFSSSSKQVANILVTQGGAQDA